MTETDIFYAYLEIRRDLLFDKIAPDEIRNNIKSIINSVDEFTKSFTAKNIFELLETAGINIEYVEGDGEFFKVKFRAQFEYSKDGNHTIYIYKKSIDELAEQLNYKPDEILEICLYHEYFHYLEQMNTINIHTLQNRVMISNWLGWKRYATIQHYSEIAAHRFAQNMCQLNNLANSIDIEYLIKVGSLKTTSIDELKKEFEELRDNFLN